MESIEGKYSNFQIVEESPSPNKWRDSVAVPSVGPNGEFNVTFFDRALIKKGEEIKMGLTPVVYSPETGFGVPRWARGHVLYEDLCAGAVAGVDASPKHWKVWQRVSSLFARGLAPATGALEGAVKAARLESIYHPEVERRRVQAGQGGLFALDAAELLAWIGLEGSSFDDLDDLEDLEDIEDDKDKD